MASKDIRDLTPFLQRVFFNFRSWYVRMFPGRDLVLTCTYRPREEQNELYQQGRTKPGPIVTNVDGIKVKGMHNYSPKEGGARAFDFAVLIKGKATWSEKYYDSAWLFFRQAGLTKKVSWGRNWKKFKDRPHIEEA